MSLHNGINNEQLAKFATLLKEVHNCPKHSFSVTNLKEYTASILRGDQKNLFKNKHTSGYDSIETIYYTKELLNNKKFLQLLERYNFDLDLSALDTICSTLNKQLEALFFSELFFSQVYANDSLLLDKGGKESKDYLLTQQKVGKELPIDQTLLNTNKGGEYIHNETFNSSFVEKNYTDFTVKLLNSFINQNPHVEFLGKIFQFEECIHIPRNNTKKDPAFAITYRVSNAQTLHDFTQSGKTKLVTTNKSYCSDWYDEIDNISVEKSELPTLDGISYHNHHYLLQYTGTNYTMYSFEEVQYLFENVLGSINLDNHQHGSGAICEITFNIVSNRGDLRYEKVFDGGVDVSKYSNKYAFLLSEHFGSDAIINQDEISLDEKVFDYISENFQDFLEDNGCKETLIMQRYDLFKLNRTPDHGDLATENEIFFDVGSHGDFEYFAAKFIERFMNNHGLMGDRQRSKQQILLENL